MGGLTYAQVGPAVCGSFGVRPRGRGLAVSLARQECFAEKIRPCSAASPRDLRPRGGASMGLCRHSGRPAGGQRRSTRAPPCAARKRGGVSSRPQVYEAELPSQTSFPPTDTIVIRALALFAPVHARTHITHTNKQLKQLTQPYCTHHNDIHLSAIGEEELFCCSKHTPSRET